MTSLSEKSIYRHYAVGTNSLERDRQLPTARLRRKKGDNSFIIYSEAPDRPVWVAGSSQIAGMYLHTYHEANERLKARRRAQQSDSA